jgi:lysozyme family protein
MTDVVGDIMLEEGWPEFTDRPDDRGGPTKGGITLAALSNYLGRPATVDELRNLDASVGRDLYSRKYVAPFAGIADSCARDVMIDSAVTSSNERSIRWLQNVLGLKEDSILGPVTIAAANALPGDVLLKKLVAHRCRMIAGDVRDNPSQIKFLAGWIARAVKPLEQ